MTSNARDKKKSRKKKNEKSKPDISAISENDKKYLF